MEINITDFFNAGAFIDFSASVAEIGENAGRETWQNAVNEKSTILDTAEKLQAMRDYARNSGGWSSEEIAQWSDNELNALFLQWVSGDIREAGLDARPVDWEQYYIDAQAGRVSGSIYPGDNGQIYFYLGE